MPGRRLAGRYLVGIALLLAWGVKSPAAGEVIYVDGSAGGANDGSSWADAFLDLQDGLTKATAGDEIWVAAGTYKPTSGTDRNATFQLEDGVAIYGGFAGTEIDLGERDWVANVTILSGDIGVQDESAFTEFVALLTKGTRAPELLKWAANRRTIGSVSDNSYHVVTGSGTGASAVLDGFTIIRGAAEGPGLSGDGGGMLNVAGSPTLANLVFEANTAQRYGGGIANHGGSDPKLTNVRFSNWSSYAGGGMFNDGSSPTVDACVFDSNIATVTGGGMHNREGSHPDLTGVTFVDNGADDLGGGLANESSSPTLADVTFEGNVAGSAGGGGMANRSGSQPVLVDVVFDGNTSLGFSPGGGAMLNVSSDPSLRNVVFASNFAAATEGGGGMANYGAGPDLVNVVFWNNSTVAYGGGMANHDGSEPVLVNVTFAGNFTTFAGGFGGAIHSSSSTPTLINTICWGNVSGPGREELHNDASVPVISSSLIAGSGGSHAFDPALGFDGGDNLDADPLFVDALTGDLHLSSGSPAIDTGIDDALPPEALLDVEGNIRVSGSRVDLGAYEYVCQPLSVVLGASWDGVSLQDVLDAEYGPGLVDALGGYAGFACGTGESVGWFDSPTDGWIVRLIATSGVPNELGWHLEDFHPPTLDGVDDGLIFDGTEVAGARASVLLPSGVSRIGFYLDPNGPLDALHAPQPETFFVNRVHNDAGPDGGGDARPPEGGDPQCLVYDVSHLYLGRPAFVLAWEERDYGSPLSVLPDSASTDLDFQDLVVEIRAMVPVSAVSVRLTAEATPAGVELDWGIEGFENLDRLEILREMAGREAVALALDRGAIAPRGTWVDGEAAGLLRYRAVGQVAGVAVRSSTVEVRRAVPERPRLSTVIPNPFNPATRIVYFLPQAERVRLSIYDTSGRLVRRLRDAIERPGEHAVTWDGRDDGGGRVSSGVYSCLLQAGSTAQALPVVLLK